MKTLPVTRREMIETIESRLRDLDAVLDNPHAGKLFPITAREREIYRAISLKLRMEQNPNEG